MSRLLKIFFTLIACCPFVFAKAQIAADFAATIPAGCAPVVVQFTDSTKGNPNKWVWDFGNGDTSHQQNPTAIYDSAGTYAVTLTASNSSSTNVITKQIIIIGSVKAGFTYQYDNVCQAPSLVHFTPVNKQDTITYLWNFDDVYKAEEPTPTYTFNTDKSYAITLITVTPAGCKDTIEQTFNVGINNLKPAFSSYSVVCKNAPVTFTNTSDPVPLSISWYVDNVLSGTGNTLLHTFSSAGNHSVKLAAKYGSCTQTYDKSITVKDKPVADFNQSGSLQSCALPATVTFTNSSTNADTYKWVFGDGNANNIVSPGYTYNTAGTFSPSLIAFNGDGCSDTITKGGLVRLGPPVITGFTSLPTGGCLPNFNVTSSAIIQSPDPVANYDWNTGDMGIQSSGSQLNHTYTKEGYYTVGLSVTTVNGCKGSFSLFQAVRAGRIPVPNFAVENSPVCASIPVKFIDKTTPAATSWNWDFGDQQSASGQNPSHLFTKVGPNNVTLYVSNFGCNAPGFTIPDAVTVLPPIAGFTFAYNCTNQLAVQFTDQSVQPLSWQWDFGDKQSSPNANPSHTYKTSGTYNVILKTTNGNCPSSDTATVVVTDDKPAILVEPAKAFVCRNDSIELSAVSHSGFVSSYSWNVGDGTPAVNDSTVKHVYTKSNDYKPYVAVQYANKCRDTIYTTEPVHVYGPTAGFTTSAAGNCLPLAVTFTDKSTTDNLHAIDSKTWYYGNGISKNTNAGTHVYTYQTGGSFTPKLIVTDAVGCVDSVTGTQSITAKGAVANFTSSVNAACDSAQVTFANTSMAYNDQIASYLWDFGDGANKTSSLANPVYAYYKSGNFKVSLTITTKSGCSVSYSQVIDVSISSKPKITITAPDAACIAADITLSAVISGNNAVSQWKWNLGNGTNKTGQTITANYSKPGPFTVRTIAVLSGACSDTAYQDITISDVPKTNAGIDSVVCVGSAILLQASGAETYTWQQVNNELSCTSCASPLATPSAPINYVVTGKNAVGCVSNDTVFIDVQNKENVEVATNEFAICKGQAVQLSASGADAYSWQPVDGLTDASLANPVASPTDNIVYTVTGTDKRHCFTDTKEVTVSVDQLPQFTIVDSALTLPRGTKHLLLTTSSPDIATWLWQPATGLSCSTCAQPELTATISGTYTATAYTNHGCSDSDKVTVLLLCDQSGIFIPTAFTPNNDGNNDHFYARSFADSKIVSFAVFNRNGVVVYRRNNIYTNASKDGWNGVYNGYPLPADTYIYKLEVLCEKGVIPFTGTVTLIR